MAEQLTEQQQQAVDNRGGKLLVSAAAGSGKTKVLVERLLSHILQSNGTVNIDDFLIITYTKAAAAELRGKIASKLNAYLAEHPENKHMQKQIQRLYLTKISTVHSFCGDILREYAYRLDIPGDFRVADERECQILQVQVLEKMMEEVYREPTEEFLNFIDSQEFGRDDRGIPKIILQVFNSARCHLSPDAWLEECIRATATESLCDASQTKWGAYLISDLHDYLDLQIAAISKCALLAQDNDTMTKPAALLQDTVYQLKQLRSYTLWDDIVTHKNIDYGRMTFSKNCSDPDLEDQIKTVRDACKAGLAKKLLPFADCSKQVLADLNSCAMATKGLIQLVKTFSSDYEKAKKIRRILDFGDLEHKMLDLLLGKNRQGTTSLAHEIGSRFVEIMVDEYQDSNAVQDAIFSALTEKRNNCFMVGDVKQSIYQFRLADPGIFLEKYNSYSPACSAKAGDGRIVMLSKNFRSAGPVIDAVNDVFSCCMSTDVGGLEYSDNERLVEGISHLAVDEPEVELAVIQVQEDTYAEEASYTADRILALLDGTHMIRQGSDQLRPITPDDIVILLRSPGSVGAEFQQALESRGIRVNSGAGIDLLQTEEISFIRSLLQIIGNPLQDIPLIAALTSRILQFTADDLAVISAGSKRSIFFDALCESKMDKAVRFVKMLKELREAARICTVCQLLDKILAVTRLDSVYGAFSDGVTKKENLQIFYSLASECEAANLKQLDQFLDYLDSLDGKGLTVAADHKMTGAVTIMSIHKSKGLEFPVVFLCGLSRDFNREDIRNQVLCNKDLGIGLTCVDLKNRVRYPSVAKKAIASRITADSISEEMRVLYVAMTRPKDRLIMTYAVKNPESELSKLVNRMNISPTTLLTSQVSCPGTWVLLTALQKTEAGSLFAIAGKPEQVICSHSPWRISVVTVENVACEFAVQEQLQTNNTVDIQGLKSSLDFVYPYISATSFPSKQTATQLKGRIKDQEAAENTDAERHIYRNWRKPTFVSDSVSGASYGNAVHKVMQHLRFSQCGSMTGITDELQRLTKDMLISAEEAQAIDPGILERFFRSEIGQKLCKAQHVLREFKFSVLDDGAKYCAGLEGEKILLQGVVDCAIIEPEGITVLDFKTDSVTDSTLQKTVDKYTLQVTSYADALSKIFQTNILTAQLYFFNLDRFVKVI